MNLSCTVLFLERTQPHLYRKSWEAQLIYLVTRLRESNVLIATQKKPPYSLDDVLKH
jgi:hypothetical protein